MMVNDFLQLVAKLEVTDFIGLSKILNVKIYKNKVETVEELEIKEFNEIFEEMRGVFTSLGKKQKKQIIKLLKQIAKTNKQKEMMGNNENENV